MVLGTARHSFLLTYIFVCLLGFARTIIVSPMYDAFNLCGSPLDKMKLTQTVVRHSQLSQAVLGHMAIDVVP